MKDTKHLGITISEDLHRKLVYMAKYEDRSINRQVLYLIKKGIAQFEKEHGEITED